MKFFDGNWLVKEGVTPHFAAEAYDAVVDGDRVALYCPDRPIGDRADTVDGGLLTIRLSSPFEDVLRVRISHFEGGPERGPRFALGAEGSAARISSREGAIEIKTGDLVARVRRKSPFLIEYLGLDPDGAERRLTSTGESRAAWFAVEGEGSFVAEQLSLGVGELIYGLGERFTPFVKNGQSIDIWNEDGGTSSEQSYKNIPFYLIELRLRPSREPSRPSLLRGGLRAGRPRAVQRPRRGAGVLPHLRPGARRRCSPSMLASPAGRLSRPPGPSASG